MVSTSYVQDKWECAKQAKGLWRVGDSGHYSTLRFSTSPAKSWGKQEKCRPVRSVSLYHVEIKICAQQTT